MTGWDVLGNIINGFSPVVMPLILMSALAAVIIFLTGFSKHGVNFLKYGFGQQEIGDLSKKIDGLYTELKTDIAGLRTEVKTDINDLRTRIDSIETNHFGHLKNYLGILNGVLLDKEIIDNETRARLDNELRGM